jgi:hypothetical protein
MEFKQDYYGLIVFLIIIVAFLVWWIRMRMGYDKRWFVIPAAPLISRNFYFFLPAFVIGSTIGLLGVFLVILDPHADPFLIIVAFGIYGMGFVLAYLEPSWLAPKWYRWLKREHGDILPDLAEEAHQLGREAWLKRVETQEDLEQWVEDFRRKHGL